MPVTTIRYLKPFACLALLLLAAAPIFGLTYNNQRVTTQVPPASGCVLPPSFPSFLTTNNTVYLYFSAIVTTSDSLSSDWRAPDGTVTSSGTWTRVSGSYCFPNHSLSITNLPSSRLGTWQARVWDNGILLFAVQFTISAPPPPPRQVTIASIDGWTTSGAEVINAQWQGQPMPPSPNVGKYYLFYAIDAPVKTTPLSALPSNAALWKVHGSGFGSQRGDITFSPASVLNTISASSSNITYWASNGTEVDFIPSSAQGYSYQQQTNISISIAGSTPQSLPRPARLPGSIAWNSGVIGTIRSRGYGQCTWYVAYVRLNLGLSIPAPAYSDPAIRSIDPNYTPQLWDVLNFGSSHTSIIITTPALTTQFNASDGSTNWTYTFTLGEMNYDWGEAPCTANNSCIQTKFTVKVAKTGRKTSSGCSGCIVVLPSGVSGPSGILSKAYKTVSATGYFR